MRRLPVYLLIDTSASMAGDPIAAVRSGLDTLLSTLRRDPHALETAHLSLMTFASEARQVIPLTEVTAFQTPSLVARGTTALGAALTLLADVVAREVVKSTPQRRGDWKPLVFLMTDGAPTDDWRQGQQALERVALGTLVACAAGADANLTVLRELTDAVVTLDRADPETISAFFQWVSASISVSSQKVDLTKKDIGGLGELPPPPPQINVAGL